MKLPPSPRLLGIIAVVALLVSIPVIVSAQGEDPPHRFFGNAFIDGQKAPNGTLIEAVSSDGKVVGFTNIRVSSATVNYVLNASRPESGLELRFRVGGNFAAETATWQRREITPSFNLNAFSDGATTPPLVPPHAFSGLVTVDGNLVAGGVIVAATIEGRKVASTITSEDGRYKLKVQQRAVNFIGKTVTFTVDGEIASQSALWRQGGVDLLDLTVQGGPRPTAEVFSNLISDGSLVTVWMYHNQTQSWSVFDPRPEVALINDLIEVARKDILWVEVSRESAFQGQTLYEGWNLITLR